MVSLDVWFDKLPEDKAKYYNKSRMSIELFSLKLGLAYQIVLDDFRRNGYRYNSMRHLIQRV